MIRDNKLRADAERRMDRHDRERIARLKRLRGPPPMMVCDQANDWKLGIALICLAIVCTIMWVVDVWGGW